jgi:hypothetical protein
MYLWRMGPRFFIATALMLVSTWAIAQERVLTAGISFRPIFPMGILNTGAQTTSVTDTLGTLLYSSTLTPKFGFTAGMVVRYGFTKMISLEAGINYVQRKYSLDFDRNGLITTSDFTIIGYEVPVQAMFFVKLAERFYMDAGAGLQLDIFPSDIYTSDTAFRHYSARNSIVNGGAIANLGWEYRTKKIGFFYLGASYHVPFTEIYTSKVSAVENNVALQSGFFGLNGSYLTFDVRYFFHEFPLPQRKKGGGKKKQSKKDPEKAGSED